MDAGRGVVSFLYPASWFLVVAFVAGLASGFRVAAGVAAPNTYRGSTRGLSARPRGGLAASEKLMGALAPSDSNRGSLGERTGFAAGSLVRGSEEGQRRRRREGGRTGVASIRRVARPWLHEFHHQTPFCHGLLGADLARGLGVAGQVTPPEQVARGPHRSRVSLGRREVAAAEEAGDSLRINTVVLGLQAVDDPDDGGWTRANRRPRSRRSEPASASRKAPRSGGRDPRGAGLGLGEGLFRRSVRG